MMGGVGEALLFDDGDDANFGLFRVVCSQRRFVARGATRSRPRMQDGRGGRWRRPPQKERRSGSVCGRRKVIFGEGAMER